MIKRIGGSTIAFSDMPALYSFASVVGKKESEGPLRDDVDKSFYDMHLGQDTWEKAESTLQKEALSIALSKARLGAQDVDFLFAGDLLNQCISSSYGLKDYNIPYLGQYGACSTMVQGLIMACMTVESGASNVSACVTSSHFCSAERQYRFPLDYGGQRPQSAQRTVTGSGCCIVSNDKTKNVPRVKYATVGKIVDYGITDKANMGACMAPAAVSTISTHLQELGLQPDYYDRIITGDLGSVGSDILLDLLKAEGFDISKQHMDCGLTIYDQNFQDVHSGGSGCGCAAVTLNGYVMQNMREGKWKRVLFVPTGALLSSVSSNEGDTVPGIAHAVAFEWKE